MHCVADARRVSEKGGVLARTHDPAGKMQSQSGKRPKGSPLCNIDGHLSPQECGVGTTFYKSTKAAYVALARKKQQAMGKMWGGQFASTEVFSVEKSFFRRGLATHSSLAPRRQLCTWAGTCELDKYGDSDGHVWVGHTEVVEDLLSGYSAC